MTIEEFLLARIAEEEEEWVFANAPYTGPMVPAKMVRDVIEWHKNWPVLVEGPHKFNDEMFDAVFDHSVFRVQSQIAWMTNQEYIKKFGVDPPTAPLLRKMAAYYSKHEDYDIAWAGA